MCNRLYNALEIPENSTTSQIRKSFIMKARQICPDRQLNHPEWEAMNEYFAYVIFAYEILKNPEMRAAYDSNGFKGLKARGISIPAGFSNFRKPVIITPKSNNCTQTQVPPTTPVNANEKAQKSTSTMKDKMKKEAKQFSEQWAKQTEEKIRMKHAHDSKDAVIRIAVYKQIVKIAWKKEMMNERKCQQFSYSKTRE